jgi:putative ABC transport system substrate-binding protein
MSRAQQAEQMRRIAVLMNTPPDDREGKASLAVFNEALQQLGWAVDRNVRIDIRWGENNEDLVRRYATELIALNPDVILASGTPGVTALRRATRTVPIVFARVADPVGAGFVNSLARPGGNVTGFMLFEYSFSAKWLELLKQVVPQLARVAVLRDPTSRAGIGEFAAIQSAAPSLGWSCGRSTQLIPTRSNAPLQASLALRMAV